MDKERKHREGCMGRLPEMAPLANPYVPFQLESPPKYEARMGLVRGTLYPGLDLPFMGMVNRNPLPDTPKHQLQALGFAINELALYLDTHPEDSEALALYREYQKMHHECTIAFEEKYGPMTHNTPVNDKRYTWMDEPWPWEYSANKEG